MSFTKDLDMLTVIAYLETKSNLSFEEAYELVSKDASMFTYDENMECVS